MSPTEHVVTTDRRTYHFGPDLAPVAEVASGDTVLFGTLDASSGRIRTQADVVETGPRSLRRAVGALDRRGARAPETKATTRGGLDGRLDPLWRADGDHVDR